MYIDFEEEEGEYEWIRDLYECLLEKIDYVKVWISYVYFEINIFEEGEDEEVEDVLVSDEVKVCVCKVFGCVNVWFRSCYECDDEDSSVKEDCLVFFNVWLLFEWIYGGEEEIEVVWK